MLMDDNLQIFAPSCPFQNAREFPLNWMVRHLQNANFKVVTSKSFAILHSEESIMRQLRVAQSKLDLMPNLALRQGMEAYLHELRYDMMFQVTIQLFAVR